MSERQSVESEGSVRDFAALMHVFVCSKKASAESFRYFSEDEFPTRYRTNVLSSWQHQGGQSSAGIGTHDPNVELACV